MKLKKLICAVLGAALLSGLSSCAKSGTAETADIPRGKTYMIQDMELPGGITTRRDIFYNNGQLFVVGAEMTQDGSERVKMQTVSPDGKLEDETVLFENDISGGVSRQIMCAFVSENGELVAAERETAVGGINFSDEKIYITKYNGGERILQADISGIKEYTDEEFLQIEKIIECSGIFVISQQSKICFADESGKILETLDVSGFGENSSAGGIFKAGDGRIFTRTADGFAEIDVQNKKVGEKFKTDLNGTFLDGTGGHDLLLLTENALVGYDIESGELTPIADASATGINVDAVRNGGKFEILPDGKILCIYCEYDGTVRMNSKAAAVLSENFSGTEKKTVTMYAIDSDVKIREQINKFNKENSEYKVELTVFNDNGADLITARTRLNNEIIAGNIPDILLLDQFIPVESYISKGLFADIYPFMDNDGDIDREDILPNVLKAFERDGKLYEAVPDFYVETIVGKTEIVGEEQNWDIDEFLEFCENNAEGPVKVFGTLYSGKSIISQLTYSGYGNFVDNASGKCHFDSEEFIKLLEFCKELPAESDNDYGEKYQNRFRSGDALLDFGVMFNFRSLREYEEWYFGGKVTAKGFPLSGGGPVISASEIFAITSGAKEPQGAWEFLKTFYSEEYQDSFADIHSYSFPVRVSSLEKQAECFLNSNSVVSMTIGGNSYEIGANTEEDNARIMDIITSANKAAAYDPNIDAIVSEEAGAFFAGGRSAEETAEIIQNRVSTYLAESR